MHEEEMFGPVMQVVAVQSCDEAIALINKYDDTPLAVYPFSNDKNVS